MGGAVFIGDELTATGFRLTGVETLTPAPAAAAEAFVDSRRRASLVILTAETARLLPAETLEAALLAERPPVSIIPDVLGRVEPAPLARRMKSVLGIES